MFIFTVMLLALCVMTRMVDLNAISSILHKLCRLNLFCAYSDMIYTNVHYEMTCVIYMHYKSLMYYITIGFKSDYCITTYRWVPLKPYSG